MLYDERDYGAEYEDYINSRVREFETYLDWQESFDPGHEPEEPEFDWLPCRNCHGSGEKPGFEDYPCPECHGEGMVEYASWDR